MLYRDVMHDSVLRRLRETFHERFDRPGVVEQARSAGQLFAGNYSPAATVHQGFGGSLIGIGVMHDLDGEIVSVGGTTWRVPVDGTPVRVGDNETIAFGVAAHGGRRHRVAVPAGLDVDGTLGAVDAYLERHHIEHEQVVCALRVEGTFRDVVLRTVAPPRYEGETLGEIIDDEVRFRFDSWTGVMIGFRFPDVSSGDTIPGLHLHGISDDRASGGHLRNMVTADVVMDLWVDELHGLRDSAKTTTSESDGNVDFARYEGPVTE